jgi:hypothetical protein
MRPIGPPRIFFMRRILSIPTGRWDAPFSPETRRVARAALEQGQALYFPALAFPLWTAERRFLDPAILSRSKNVSYDPSSGSLGGTGQQGRDAEDLRAVLHRYADATNNLFANLLSYGPALNRERTSLRPAQIEGRVTSWRKDDTRLHVDSFPSAPVQGRRILRLFCNVNPQNRPRTWRLGEPFAAVAQRFWERLPAPRWLQRHVLSLIRVTKGLRSEYDHYMLALHDAMKSDEEYQRSADQETIDFPAGSAWACFTDQVSHAAMAGQHQLEQTFSLPVESMEDRGKAPLSVLEHLAGRPLAPRGGRKAA